MNCRTESRAFSCCAPPTQWIDKSHEIRSLKLFPLCVRREDWTQAGCPDEHVHRREPSCSSENISVVSPRDNPEPFGLSEQTVDTSPRPPVAGPRPDGSRRQSTRYKPSHD